MSLRPIFLSLLGLCVLVPALAVPRPAGAAGIHGTVTTVDGDTYTGPIRWDKNENFWDDVIDATKNERVENTDRGHLNINIFGLKINHSGNNRSWSYSQLTVPFGHLARIEPLGGKKVQLDFKNGDSMEVREGADLGGGIRGVVIGGGESGEVKLDWEDLQYVEFSEGEDARDDTRLYGKVETTIGDFTGYIVWDRDESMTGDILDGEVDGDDREIPFSDIAAIARVGSRGSRVTLRSGRELLMTGTNDVDNDNRGIDINIRDMGRVQLSWKEFKQVTFMDPPASPRYADFDGGRRLMGTVETLDGQTLSGEITWDRDEKYSWEALDGEIQNVAMEILFENVDRVERASHDSARIILRDGLEFVLEGSNDVNHKNKGIVVTAADGTETEVTWKDFVAASFSGR